MDQVSTIMAERTRILPDLDPYGLPERAQAQNAKRDFVVALRERHGVIVHADDVRAEPPEQWALTLDLWWHPVRAHARIEGYPGGTAWKMYPNAPYGDIDLRVVRHPDPEVETLTYRCVGWDEAARVWVYNMLNERKAQND